MPTPETVLFDLDDIICAYRKGAAAVRTAAFERDGVELFFDSWGGSIGREITVVASAAGFQRRQWGCPRCCGRTTSTTTPPLLDAFGAEYDHADV